MIKKAVLVIVSLSVGIVIGYLYGDYYSEEQEETTRQSTEGRKQNEYTSIPRNVYYTGDDDWEDMDFQEWDNFGPV